MYPFVSQSDIRMQGFAQEIWVEIQAIVPQVSSNIHVSDGIVLSRIAWFTAMILEVAAWAADVAAQADLE